MDPRDPARTEAGRTTVAEATPAAAAARAAQPPPAVDADPARRPHPLEPLSAEEVHATAAAVRAHPGFADGSVFVSTSLREPPKPALSQHALTSRPPDRESTVVLYDRSQRQVVEAVVSHGDSSERGFRNSAQYEGGSGYLGCRDAGDGRLRVLSTG